MANEAHVVHDSRFPPALPSYLTVGTPGMRALREKKRGRDTESDKIQQLAPDWWLYSLFSLFTRRLSPRPLSKLPGYPGFDNRSHLEFFRDSCRPLDLSSNLVKIKPKDY